MLKCVFLRSFLILGCPNRALGPETMMRFKIRFPPVVSFCFLFVRFREILKNSAINHLGDNCSFTDFYVSDSHFKCFGLFLPEGRAHYRKLLSWLVVHFFKKKLICQLYLNKARKKLAVLLASGSTISFSGGLVWVFVLITAYIISSQHVEVKENCTSKLPISSSH